MKKSVKKFILIFFATGLLTVSYSHVLHKNNHADQSTLVKIQELKDKTAQLPDVEMVKKVLKFIAHLLPKING